MSLDRRFSAIARFVSRMAGRPITFILAVSLILLWGVSGPLFGFSDTWQLVVNTATTIITFLMVFVIQNSQNRDAAAMQAKLDEIIRAVADARNQFIGVEHLTDIELEKVLEALEQECGIAEPESAGRKLTHHGLMVRLLHRHKSRDGRESH